MRLPTAFLVLVAACAPPPPDAAPQEPAQVVVAPDDAFAESLPSRPFVTVPGEPDLEPVPYETGSWDTAPYPYRSTLLVTGSCPGMAEVRVLDGHPNARFGFVTANRRGSLLIPSGRCTFAGGFGIQGDATFRGMRLGPNGRDRQFVQLESADCGKVIQVLDFNSCRFSRVARLPRAQP
jgi:hypothetical protein